MKLKKIIILICTILIISSGVVVFAAYSYTKRNTISAKSGNISIESENYLSYALNEEVEKTERITSAEYKAILKERAGETKVDTSSVSDFETEVGAYSNYFSRSVSEVATGATFDANTRYYIKDDIGTYILQSIKAFEDGVTYYTISYATASSSDCYRLGHKLVSEGVSESNYSSYYVLDSVDGQGYGVFKTPTSYSSDEMYFEIVYSPKFTTTNGEITSENYGTTIACINTYATERKGTSQEETMIYLNQVGFQFSIKTNIKSYIRIKFYDAWISSKLYPGSTDAREVYVSKGQISGSGRSPFYVNNDAWYYDNDNNICYLKTTLDPSDNLYTYTFNINDTYFYNTNANTVYTENIKVQVSYSIECIQANRAKAVWGVDPSELGSGN